MLLEFISIGITNCLILNLQVAYSQSFNSTTANPLDTWTRSSIQLPNFTQLPLQQQLYQRQIKVGILIPDNTSLGSDSWVLGFDTNAGAATVALDRIVKEQLLPNTNFTFVWYYSNCDESLSGGYVSKLIREDKVDVIIGPVCTDEIKTAGVLGKYYNMPFLIWGSIIGSELNNKQRYPTLTLNAGTTWSMVLALISVFEEFDWNEYAFFYAPRRSTALARCIGLQDDIDAIPFQTTTNMTLIYKKNVANDSYAQLKATMQLIKSKARIIVGCFEIDSDRRNFMLAAAESGLDKDEYVFIMLEIRKKGYGIPRYWLDADGANDGKDAIVERISSKLLIVCLRTQL
ncbi:receptor family ligand binding region domain-containing protein [Ditylenchus destructor]|nr:receptor family ligand binding region domain-containing protein [Ditylenchus destructor]